MKKRIIIFVIVLSAFAYSCTRFDKAAYLEEIRIHRENINKEFADTAHSPLTEEGLANFQGLDFYPADPDWVIEADFVLNPDPEPFEMETTTARRPIYVKYGEAHFTLDGTGHMLEIYQSEKAMQMEEFKEYLFLPFKDKTNGEDSYGGGRFIDLKIPEGETIIIDFNKSYNPYCAYNHRYSCPVPPEVNHLNIPVPAGVKGYKEH
jgi:uncharacterized protein (DUF1684 family)